MRIPFLALFTLLTVPALACTVSQEWVNLPYSQKLSPTAFLGKVISVTPVAWGKPGEVSFTVLSSHGTPEPGTAITVKHQDYGTCGTLPFAVGQVWLYSDDSTFGASLQPTEADLGPDSGKDFEKLLARIIHRLEAREPQK